MASIEGNSNTTIDRPPGWFSSLKFAPAIR